MHLATQGRTTDKKRQVSLPSEPLQEGSAQLSPAYDPRAWSLLFFGLLPRRCTVCHG